MPLTLLPAVLLHGLDDDDEEEGEEVEALPDVGARNLEQVVLVKLLEDTALKLYEVVAHHDGEESFVTGIDGHIEGGGL